MSDAEIAAFFAASIRGALATRHQLDASYGFTGFRRLMDVGGGSGGWLLLLARLARSSRDSV